MPKYLYDRVPIKAIQKGVLRRCKNEAPKISKNETFEDVPGEVSFVNLNVRQWFVVKVNSAMVVCCGSDLYDSDLF